MNWCVAASYETSLFEEKRATTSRGVHVNGGLAITGYSDLATGYPGCRHHGIFRTCMYTWRLFAFCPPFYMLCAHGGRCVEREKRREIEEEEEKDGEEEGEALKEKKRGKMREGEERT